jgi:hypothetical protein
MWLGLGLSIVVTCIAAVLLQKKTAKITLKTQEISLKNGELTQKTEEITRKDLEIRHLSEELAAVKSERDEKRNALEKLEREFEDQMDEIVQSSIQKLTHSEQTKEEAIRAAQDNYEAVAEIHALLKEKEALIDKLQQQVAQASG